MHCSSVIMFEGFDLHLLARAMLVWLISSAVFCQKAVAGPAPPEILADLGENVTLPCPGAGGGAAVWVRDGRAMSDAAAAADGTLTVLEAAPDDEGLYGCRSGDGDGADVRYVRLLVRRAPGPLVNVAVHAHTVLAELFWHVNDTGRLPLTRIGLRYRAEDADAWKTPIPHHVAPTETHRELYHLKPNRTYVFEVWSENELGAGPKTAVRATTQADPSQSDVARGLVAEALVLGSESWVAAVAVSLAVVVLVSVGGACLLFRTQRSVPPNGDSTESMELVSHLQQPGYELEVIEQDENSNSQRAHLLNNNVEIHPVRI